MGCTFRYTFDVVKLKAQKSGKCKCGKRVTRSTTFEQTLNPWNRRPDGCPKNRGDIMKELVAESDAWKLLPVTCSVCADADVDAMIAKRAGKERK